MPIQSLETNARKELVDNLQMTLSEQLVAGVAANVLQRHLDTNTLWSSASLLSKFLAQPSSQKAELTTTETDPLAERIRRSVSSHGGDQFPFKLGVQYEPKRGFILFAMGSDAAIAEACRKLAIRHEYGRGAKRDMVEDARWYRAAADRGSAADLGTMARFYKEGLFVQQDIVEAIRLYELAARRGDWLSKTMLVEQLMIREGRCGEGLSNWPGRLAVSLQILPHKMDAVVPTCLALMYEEGAVVKQDLTEAARLYRELCKEDIAVAQFRLARMLETGQGVPQDLPKAKGLYASLVVMFGYAPAAVCFALVLHRQRSADAYEGSYKGFQRTNHDPLKDFLSSFVLGLRGRGLQGDDGRLPQFFSRIAMECYSPAHMRRGDFADQKSIANIIVQHCERHAEENQPEAQFVLGFLYRRGYGVAKDRKQARAQYKLSAQQGYAPAQAVLDQMARRARVGRNKEENVV